jgi:hypothetical protein
MWKDTLSYERIPEQGKEFLSGRVAERDLRGATTKEFLAVHDLSVEGWW